MCDFILTEQQQEDILKIAQAVNNDIEKGTFYRYDGSKAPQRQFCRIMMSMNKLYTKDDINRMSFQGLNSQFAKKGTNRYSIFKYRGGANCQHYWREIEVKIDEDGLPYEIDKGIVDDSKVERLNFSEQQQNNTEQMNIFELILDEDNKDGVYGASLVAEPAIEMEMLFFSSNGKSEVEEPIKWKLSNEEKRIVISPVLIPDQKIYRNSIGKDKKPGYTFVSAPTIEKLQQNFWKQQYNKNSTIEHQDKIEDVYFYESWIIEDPKNDKANALGYNLPKGTWMLAMKVENVDVWENYIKTGLVTGLSIDALLRPKQITESVKFKKMDKIELLFKNALKQAIIEMEAEKQFTIKISDELSYFTNEPLAMDVLVYDNETGELVKEMEFIFEGKKYKTGTEGQIISVEDIVEEEKTEDKEVIEQSSETLGKFEGENGVVVFAEWLSLGKTLFGENQELLPDFSFEYEGKIYSTNEVAEIVKLEKNPTSPYWKVELAAETPADVIAEDTMVETPVEEVDKDTRIAELEAMLAEKEALVLELEAKLADAETKINKLEADFVLKENEVVALSKETPSSMGIIDRPVEDKSIRPSSALEAIRKVTNNK